MPRRATVKLKNKPGTRAHAAAEFGRKKAKLKRKQSHRRIILIGAGVFVAYVVIGSWWLVHTGKLEHATDAVENRIWSATDGMGFTLKQVMLTGRNHADAKAVKAALDVQQGQPILALPLEQMKERLEKIPEVKSAVISRELPGTLYVALTERQPAAIWQYNGKLQFIDREGVVLARDTYHEKMALPLVVGEDAPAHIGELMSMLESVPSLMADVTAAVRVGGRRWNIEINHEITVLLPEDAPEKAWARFAKLVAEKGLLTKAIRSVDMRMEDRVFIMPVEEHKNPVTQNNARDT